MRKIIAIPLFPLYFAAACMHMPPAHAQTQPALISVSWTLPTQSATGGTLAGTPDALTGVQVFVDTAPIADTSTLAPAQTLGPSAVKTTYSTDVPLAGATLYVRLKAVNAAGPGAFSAQASKVIPAWKGTPPAAPAAVAIG